MSSTRRMRLTFGTGLALLLAACSAKTADMSNGVVANDTAAVAAAAGSDANLNAHTDLSANTAILLKYVGKHPSEALDGTRFVDEPTVRNAVAATVTDAEIRAFVSNYGGPDAPIVVKDGRILAWGCERHNCGYHNWSVSITPDGRSAEVCFYHNDDSPDGPAMWYLPTGKTEKRPGNCPSD